MSLLAFLFVLISAFMHATWNFLAKQSEGGFLFVWLYMSVSAVTYAPVAIGVIMLQDAGVGWVELGFIAASALIHLAYSLTLQKGYSIGDFSLVYPIARGSGPLLVAIAAVFIYGEKLTMVSMSGIFLIVASVFLLTGGLGAIKRSSSLLPLVYGLVIGVFIAGYTLLDKGAVSVILLSPILLNYGSILGQLVLLTPFAWKNRKKIKAEWSENRKRIIGVGILNPFAYILVLTTMIFTPVSHVAPVREISILIGTMMGARLLDESSGLRRPISALLMFVGVVAVAFSK